METIYKRASVRKFTDQQVTDEQVEALMRAAMAAPSAGNQQPWTFVVARDVELKKALSQVSPYAKPGAGASVVIAVCKKTGGLRFPGCAPQDLSAAIENLLLEVTDLGLGAVWMGIAPDPARMSAVAEILELGETLEPFALVAVGYPDGEVCAKGAERYDASRVIWK